MNVFNKRFGDTGFLHSLFVIIIAVLSAIIIRADSCRAQPYLCGDPNGDGAVNIGDAVNVIDYIFRGGILPDQPDAADVNCNGGIDIGDAVYLIGHIFKDKPAPCSECPPIDQYILFEICYSNFAWGSILRGFYVTNDGQVIHYNYNGTAWPAPQWYEEYTEWDLLFRYSHNPEPCRIIPPDELYAMYELVPAAGEGELSDSVARCFDFGEVYFVAYIFDADNCVYQPVLLELAGDFAQKNFAPEAEQLVEWLMMCGWDDIPCRY